MRTKNSSNGPTLDFLVDTQSITEVPRAIVALAKEYPDGFITPFHQHYRAQLVYASSGVITVTTTTGVWVVPPLRAVWMPAFTKHRVRASGRLSMRTLYIEPEAVPDMPKNCFVLSVPPLMRELILHAVTLPHLYPINSPDERIISVILDQIKLLEIAPLDLPIPMDGRLKKIYKGLTEKLDDTATLDKWGKRVGATRRTLTRLFRSETGMSFTHWRQQIRIMEALRRLGRGEPVTAVSLDLGYDSPSAFIAMFKKALGKTPGDYFKT